MLTQVLRPRELAAQVPIAIRSVEVLYRSGLVPLARPDRVLRALLAASRLGPVAGAARIAANRDAQAVGLVDELGPLTYAELDRRSNSLARALAARGVGGDSVIALLARDHRGAVDTMLAAAKLGARLLLLNTGFAAPQLVDVVERERVSALVYDAEFAELISALPDLPGFLAWVEARSDVPAVPTLDELITSTDDRPLPAPREPGGFVLLTSGTTGTPKGAPRTVRNPLAVAQFLDRIPLRVAECTVLAAPMFHGMGLSQFLVSMALGSTVVVRRAFDPEATLAAVHEHRASALIVVPTMLQRIIDLGEEMLARYDTSGLRVVLCGGSALPPDLGNRAIETFGNVLYNFYGSTEVAVGAVATPQDWQAAPGTVGRPPVGCRVALYDDTDRRITEPDAVGRVFVGSGLSFGGYTDGRNKKSIDGLLSIGDVGHFDSAGRLFIDGRDDDMIVSGGENVFPGEVENLLVSHGDVVEAAVVGVSDEEFGQRLAAFVVLRAGSTLDAEGVRQFVRANLARFKAPRDVVFLEELPRNATGKVLRHRLTGSG